VTTDPWRPRAVPYALAAAWIVLMALSRTVVDHHWLSDVVAGSLIGAGAAVVTGAALQAIRDSRRAAPARDS
jgi:undecaprenyl-diphosphatase